MVAKESRFVDDECDGSADSKRFHMLFCETQTRAQNLAVIFNDRLSQIPGLPPTTARVSFIPCSVYTVEDRGVLVEEELDAKQYRQWNDNKGWHLGADPAVVGPGCDAIVEEDKTTATTTATTAVLPMRC